MQPLQSINLNVTAKLHSRGRWGGANIRVTYFTNAGVDSATALEAVSELFNEDTNQALQPLTTTTSQPISTTSTQAPAQPSNTNNNNTSIVLHNSHDKNNVTVSPQLSTLMAMIKNITHHQHEQQTIALTFAIQRNSDYKNIRLLGQHVQLRRVAGCEAIRVLVNGKQLGDLCHAPISVLCPILDNIERMPFTVSEAIVTEEVHLEQQVIIVTVQTMLL